MTDKQTGLTQQRKSSTNKNIRKLRTISMVCGLASSWQQWAADNEKKQASEPSGWAPASLGGPTEEPRKKWVPKKNPPTQVHPADGSKPHISSGDASLSSQKSPETVVQQRAEPSIGAAIKVKQVMKTVTSGVQEKGASINLLAEKIKRESLPSEDEIDRILKKKSSPTRRRKCSNMVSSLTKSWKQVENRPGGKDGGQPGERTSWVGSGDHSGDLDGKTRVTFGQLFDRYVRISDKVVGILMRARKHGKVAFEGEMLWQGQDDGIIITLLV